MTENNSKPRHASAATERAGNTDIRNGQHTPVPWRLDSGMVVAGLPNSGCLPQIIALAVSPTDEANAAFIVRAVNSHDALLAACKAAIAYIESPSRFAYTSDEMSLIRQLRAAIAKAESAP